MRGRLLIAAVLVAQVAGCGAEPTAGVPFARVALPEGAAPSVLGAAGDGLLVGVSWSGRETAPGLLEVGRGGAVAEVPLTPTTPYGAVAKWSSVTGDGERLLAVGGERGGAHGNVRWSVWTGTRAGVVERKQGFSTFGGYGAGDLVGGVLTPDGPVVVGAWESARAALDVAVWTIDATHTATRRSSAGTPLESSREEIAFPISAAAHGGGLVIAGWQIHSSGGTSKQVPVIWRSTAGATGWTKQILPDAGASATADAVHCGAWGCAVTGRVDGTVAVWRLAGDTWTRVAGMPAIPAGDRERLVAPAEVDGALLVAVADADRTKLALWRDGAWSVAEVEGPEGGPLALSTGPGGLYLVTGPDEAHAALWRGDPAALR